MPDFEKYRSIRENQQKVVDVKVSSISVYPNTDESQWFIRCKINDIKQTAVKIKDEDGKKWLDVKKNGNSDTMENFKLYTKKEVAEILGVTERTVWNYIKAGKIKATIIGGKWKITEENLKKYVEGM